MTPFEQAIDTLANELDDKKCNQIISNLVAQHPSLVKQVDAEGYTLLHRSIRVTTCRTLRQILDSGADINALTHSGISPFGILGNIAYSKEDQKCITLFKERGARFTEIEELAYLIINHKNVEAIARLEADSQLLSRSVPLLRRPLFHVAVNWNNGTDLIRYFLDHGVDSNVTDEDAMTALHLEAFQSHPKKDVMKLLLERGAAVNAKNNRGWTPLHYAVDEEAAAAFLLEQGADINALTNDGETPLDRVYACKFPGFVRFAVWLKHRGALRGSELR